VKYYVELKEKRKTYGGNDRDRGPMG